MSSPGGGGGVLNNLYQNLEYGLRDVGKGVGQIASGNVGGGIGTTLGGAYAAAFNTGTIAKGSGFNEAGQAEANTLNQIDASGQAAFETRRRQEGVNLLLDELIRMRTKTPGRSQTLLTSGITPNSTYTNSLLTRSAR